MAGFYLVGFLWGLWIAGLVVGLIARSKGRGFWRWWLYGAGFFIVAIFHVCLIAPDVAAIDDRKYSQGGRKCSDCAEIVKQTAKVCRYCGHRFDASDAGGFDAPKLGLRTVDIVGLIGTGLLFGLLSLTALSSSQTGY